MPYRLLAATELAEFLRALAHPRRIQILEELRSDERDVASLANATGLAHSSVSQHMMVLRTHRVINQVLGCVDVSGNHSVDAELNDKVCELAASISKFHNARCSVFHAWEMQDEALLSARLKKEQVAGFVRDHRNATKKRFDEFLRRHESDVDSENAHFVKGSPEETIEKFIRENSVDLIVMGTVARSGLAGMLFGNTAEKIIDRIECSLLALKPYDFTTSVTLKRGREPTMS